MSNSGLGVYENKAAEIESIMSLFHDPILQSRINAILEANDIPTSNPTLRLELESTENNYELNQEDLQALFKQFGEVKIQLFPNCTALLHFKTIHSAYLSLQCLNNTNITSLNAKLKLRWLLSDEQFKNESPKIEEKAPSAINVINSMQNGYQTQANLNPPTNEVNSETTSKLKYTCRFDIQIENDKEFQVARKLIGPKGSNMKKILELCSKGSNLPIQDVIKLRLRGKGSGFKEGPEHKESDDPLHLCISSRFYNKYILACHLSEELINNVYDEYKKYCQKNGKTFDQELKPKKSENFTGTKLQGMINYSKPSLNKQNINPVYNQQNYNYFDLQTAINEQAQLKKMYDLSQFNKEIDSNNNAFNLGSKMSSLNN